MKRSNFFIFILFFVLLFLAMVLPTFAVEKPKGYPTRPIEIVIRSGPGSGSEFFARSMTEEATKILGVPFQLTFKAGAGGDIATSYFFDQPADGYTLEEASPTMVTNVVLGRANYKLDDFIWLVRGAHDISAIHTRADNKQFQTFKDVQEFCKKNPNIGLTVAGADAMSFDHVWVELLNKRGKVNLKFVPFPKSSMRKASFQGGYVVFQSDELIDLESLYKAGISKPILIGYTKRIKKYPDVPCTKELGIENYLGRWRGFCLKKGTPEPIVKYLEWAFEQSFKSKRMQDYLEKELGHDRTVFMGREAFTKDIMEEYNIFTEIMKELF